MQLWRLIAVDSGSSIRTCHRNHVYVLTRWFLTCAKFDIWPHSLKNDFQKAFRYILVGRGFSHRRKSAVTPPPFFTPTHPTTILRSAYCGCSPSNPYQKADSGPLKFAVPHALPHKTPGMSARGGGRVFSRRCILESNASLLTWQFVWGRFGLP